jgi:hypothetical protein
VKARRIALLALTYAIACDSPCDIDAPLSYDVSLTLKHGPVDTLTTCYRPVEGEQICATGSSHGVLLPNGDYTGLYIETSTADGALKIRWGWSARTWLRDGDRYSITTSDYDGEVAVLYHYRVHGLDDEDPRCMELQVAQAELP